MQQDALSTQQTEVATHLDTYPLPAIISSASDLCHHLSIAHATTLFLMFCNNLHVVLLPIIYAPLMMFLIIIPSLHFFCIQASTWYLRELIYNRPSPWMPCPCTNLLCGGSSDENGFFSSVAGSQIRLLFSVIRTIIYFEHELTYVYFKPIQLAGNISSALSFGLVFLAFQQLFFTITLGNMELAIS